MTDRVDYVLQELRCASLRARLVQHDIEAIGLALKGGLITPEEAVEDLHDCNALQYVIPTPPIEQPADQAPRLGRPVARPRPTPQVTVEALVLEVREHGIKALHEPRNQERLKGCDAASRRQLNERLAKLLPEGAIP